MTSFEIEGAADASRPALGAPAAWLAVCRRLQGDEAGLTLIELLVVLVIIPLVVGALAAVVIISVRDEGAVSGRLSDSASAQTTSAYYVRDIQSAAYVTTNGTTASPAPCGSGSSFELGLYWGNPTAGGAVVSYWEVPVAGNPPTMNLVRRYCSGGSSTPASTVTVSQGLSSTAGISATIVPANIATNAAANWTPTLGIASISLSALQSSSTFHFDLLAVPRLSEGPAPGGNPAPPPLLLLGTGTNVLNCQGNGHINVVGTAYLDSTSDGSGNVTHNASLTATQIYSADPNPSQAFTGGGSVTPSPPTSGPVVPDPYSGLTPPSSTGLPVYTDGSLHGPGVYTNTVSLSAPGNYVMATGTYILQNGISVSGQANLSSASGGVLLYITGGAVSFAGQGNVSLAPLSPPPYAAAPNLGIWQASSDTQPLSLSGNGSANTYSGMIYAPNAQVNNAGNAGYSAGAVVAASMACTGSGSGTATIG